MDFFGLWMCKRKLEQIPVCTCQNLNPNTFSSSQLLPSKQRCNKIAAFWLHVLCKRKLEQIPVCAKTQSKHIFIFTAATHKQRCNIEHLLRMWAKIVDRKLCLAMCTNVECASAPPEAELQRSAAENRRGHKHRVLHSARTVHAQCTLQCTPQCTATKRCKYHVFSQK